MRDCLAKSCNPFSFICPSGLCHKSGEVSSSTAFSCPLHTFTCILYNEQYNLPRATTNNPLVSFQFPLLIEWLYPSLSSIFTKIRFRRRFGMCHTSFNINVHPILVCMQMLPIPTIWEILLFPIFTTPNPPILYVEKYSLLRTQWYDAAESTTHLTSWYAT